MGRSISVEDVAEFLTIDPSVAKFRCIYPWTTKGRTCSKEIAKCDHNDAILVKQKILSPSCPEDRLELLGQFAVACCCTYHLRRMNKHPLPPDLRQKWDDLPQRWESELTLRGSTTGPDGIQSSPKASTDKAIEDSLTLVHEPSTTTSRYLLRSGGPIPLSMETNPTAQSPQKKFVPARIPKHTFAKQLLLPLSTQDQKSGELYAFSRVSSPGMLKIGCSSVSAQSRYKKWNKSCGYVPVEEHVVKRVSNVYRVEKLTHIDLLPYWRQESQCEHYPHCLMKHLEWFECPISLAMKSMDNISAWMRLAEPYDSKGSLRPWWRDLIKGWEMTGQEITSQMLLDAVAQAQTPSQKTEAMPLSQHGEAESASLTLTQKPTSFSASPKSTYERSFYQDSQVSQVIADVLCLQPHQVATIHHVLDLLLSRIASQS